VSVYQNRGIPNTTAGLHLHYNIKAYACCGCQVNLDIIKLSYAYLVKPYFPLGSLLFSRLRPGVFHRLDSSVSE